MPPVRDLTSSLLLEHVGRNLQRRCGVRHGDRLVAGVSGGADSVALLRLLIGLAPRLRLELVVAHFDHALRPESAADADFVASLAREHGLAFENARWSQPVPGEAAARRARHALLAQAARAHDGAAIVLAHHLEDRIETALLQMGRGAGPRGLAGVAWRRDSTPPVVRPLLDVSRTRLRDFLAECGQTWCEDASNRSRTPRRNRIRADTLPALDATLPAGWMQRWSKSLDDLLEVRAWLDAQAAALLAGATCATTKGGESFTRAPLQAVPEALRRTALQRWIGAADIGRAHLEAADRLVRHGQSGQWIALPGGRRLVLEQDRVTLLQAAATADISGIVEVETAIASLALDPAPSRAPALAQLEAGCTAVAAASAIVMPLELRRCKRGDRVRLLNSPGAKSVHRILQSRRVPERLRGDWPVVSDARGIVWIPGVGVAERGRVVAASETALRFHWRPREAAPVGLRNPVQVLTLD